MITIDNDIRYYGESTDEKPSNADINDRLKELDTGNVYYYDGTTWSKVGG